MPVRALDYSALTAPVAREEVTTWRAAMRASGVAWAARTASAGGVLAGIAVVVVFVFIFGGVVSSALSEGLQNGNAFGILLPLIFLGVLAVAVAAAIRARLQHGGAWEQWLRLDRFARANGFVFTPVQGEPDYPGEIFHLGRDQAVLSHLVSSSGRFLDIGNYRYTTGSGRDSTIHNWGFMALSLDRAMPNIVLDSKANNTLFGSNLPATLDKSQILHLEGDFDRYFTLYCPAQYEQDALYLFTPDLMALLIDEASPFDVELVDRWMFVYSSKPFAMTDPAVLQRLITIADTVGAKAVSQSARYADDRIGDPAVNIVAPQGARLKRRVSALAVVAVVALVAFWGWSFFSPIVGAFFGG